MLIPMQSGRLAVFARGPRQSVGSLLSFLEGLYVLAEGKLRCSDCCSLVHSLLFLLIIVFSRRQRCNILDRRLI